MIRPSAIALPSSKTSAVLALLVLSSCIAASPDDDPGIARASIVNGMDITSSYRATCFLHTSTTSCTATLIGTRTGLTAAHCGPNGDSVRLCDFECGNVDGCFPTCVRGTLHRHPRYVDGQTFDQEDFDVAVITLDADFTRQTGIAPYRIGGPPTRGDLIELIGYGGSAAHSEVGLGQKRRGLNFVSDVGAERIEYEDESLSYGSKGDSGGPALAYWTDCQIGVFHGWWQIPVFDSDYTLSRIDTKLAWIRATANDLSVNTCGQTTCGDTVCVSPESCTSCPGDCGVCPVCGDGSCAAFEWCGSCPGDCGVCPPVCGDGACTGDETSDTCLEDCPVHCQAGAVDCCRTGVCIPYTTCSHTNCDE